MALVKVYAHNDDAEAAWYGQEECKRLEVDPESEEGKKIVALFEDKPMYEVEATFDSETGEVLEAVIGGKTLKPV